LRSGSNEEAGVAGAYGDNFQGNEQRNSPSRLSEGVPEHHHHHHHHYHGKKSAIAIDENAMIFKTPDSKQATSTLQEHLSSYSPNLAEAGANSTKSVFISTDDLTKDIDRPDKLNEKISRFGRTDVTCTGCGSEVEALTASVGMARTTTAASFGNEFGNVEDYEPLALSSVVSKITNHSLLTWTTFDRVLRNIGRKRRRTALPEFQSYLPVQSVE